MMEVLARGFPIACPETRTYDLRKSHSLGAQEAETKGWEERDKEGIRANNVCVNLWTTVGDLGT